MGKRQDKVGGSNKLLLGWTLSLPSLDWQQTSTQLASSNLAIVALQIQSPRKRWGRRPAATPRGGRREEGRGQLDGLCDSTLHCRYCTRIGRRRFSFCGICPMCYHGISSTGASLGFNPIQPKKDARFVVCRGYKLSEQKITTKRSFGGQEETKTTLPREPAQR